MKVVTVLGAGGKMGLRITANLQRTDYTLRCVEISDRGQSALAERGITAMPINKALEETEAVILALPDNRIGAVAAQIEPLLKPGVMLIALDIAAPMAGSLPKRDDLTYFVTHPCHPSVFGGDTDPRAQKDFFGGAYALQNIVCALVQGPEE